MACKPRAWLGRLFFAVLLPLPLVAGASEEKPFFTVSPLAAHPSPYLRSHANDPVRWRSLSENSLSIAREEGKPILISTGYLSCYWCFRMKQDTFSDPDLAELINSRFVAVLVDRELQPEEDAYLQHFLESSQKVSGWPATLILTPAGDPVFGYTYIDAATLHRSLGQFLQRWQQSAAKIVEQTAVERSRYIESMTLNNSLVTGRKTGDLLLALLDQASSAADPEFGGFGQHEKYPFVPQLLALLDINLIHPDPGMTAFLEQTIDQMLNGALVDQIGGGVFRYTENRNWRNPHFEQMLYTQALTVRLLVRAGKALRRPDYLEWSIRIASHLVDNFKAVDGWYLASRSAVSEQGRDGGYYLWSEKQLRMLFGETWQSGIEDLAPGQGLVLPRPGGSNQELNRKRMEQERNARTLETDGKKITGWNGLVLSALSSVASVSTEFIPDVERLAGLLVQAIENDKLSYLAANGAGPSADLSTLVYTAGGLFDWWQLTAEPRILHLTVRLLAQAEREFLIGREWSQNPTIIAPPVRQQAIADTQLPSPSAEWLRLSHASGLANADARAEFADSVELLSTNWTEPMFDQAFFHATLIATLVTTHYISATRSDTIMRTVTVP